MFLCSSMKCFSTLVFNTLNSLVLMCNSLFNSPGAHLASAKGLLWGLVNAVTHDVDFNLPKFNAGDGGKTAVYRPRWVNTRGEKGPWSEIATATVAA